MQQESQILKERRKLNEAKGKSRGGKPSPKMAPEGAAKGGWKEVSSFGGVLLGVVGQGTLLAFQLPGFHDGIPQQDVSRAQGGRW